jgi:hypothetical protein
MAETLAEQDWQILVGHIKAGTCTAFIGAGASHPSIDLGGTIARNWANDCQYPLPDGDNLARVAQFIALNPDGALSDPTAPKRKIVEYLKKRPHLDSDDPDDPYNVLARLPIPIYITTNYDAFMVEALKRTGRTPRREFCRWNRRLEKRMPLDAPIEPEAQTPVVYHLHGHEEVVDSLVLTEADYIDFIVNVSQRPELIPTPIQDAMTDNALLFLGYSLSDWNFKVFFRTLQNYLEKSTRGGHVSVQLEPDPKKRHDERERATRYLTRYFREQSIVVFWGTCRKFAQDLGSWYDKLA